MKNIKTLIIAAITMLSTIAYGQTGNYEDALKYYTNECDRFIPFRILFSTPSFDLQSDSPNQILKVNEAHLHILRQKAEQNMICDIVLKDFQKVENLVKQIITEESDLADIPLGEALSYMLEKKQKQTD